jgi:hypothetical protein
VHTGAHTHTHTHRYYNTLDYTGKSKYSNKLNKITQPQTGHEVRDNMLATAFYTNIFQ